MKRGKMNKFNLLNIENDILQALEKKQYEEMTEIQEKVIPIALEEKDIIAQAPTGTGKTMAFAIPMIQAIIPTDKYVQALILSPTRELAVQITTEIKSIAYSRKELHIVTLYGGEYIEKQITGLGKKPQIIVATPGRLLDHIRRKTVDLSRVQMLVLDEADEMLNMGFKEELDDILSHIVHPHQTMLFSATISPEIEKLAKTYLIKPVTIRASANQLSVPNITQEYIEIEEKDKIEVISRLLDVSDYQLCMVFCNTKKMVDEVTSGLSQRGYSVEALHGDMKQMQRDRVMNRFRLGQIQLLVASDVAARGLDIDDVDVVFNYDVPTDEEYYVHRIGRTGRAKKTGLAITLATKREKFHLRNIMAFTKTVITKRDIPSLEEVMKIRIQRIIGKAIESKSKKYENVIRELLLTLPKENLEAEKLIYGLIMMQLNENLENDIQIKKNNTKTTRCFINIGKKDDLKSFQLAELLIKRTTLTNKDIDNIEILDSFSFFEIPKDKLDEVIFAFYRPINGRKINIEEAKERKKTSNYPEKKERSRKTNSYNKAGENAPHKRSYRSRKTSK